MKRMFLLFAAMLCLSLWGVAQTSQDATQPNPSATSSGNASMTVDGCLGGSAGAYTITDKTSGTTYKLEGSTSKMAAHVGHEVQVTGTTSGGSSDSSASSASSASAMGGGSQTLTVTSFKHVAATCSASK